MLKRLGERADPLAFVGRLFAESPSQHFHPEQPDGVDCEPKDEAEIALFSQNLKIGAVIGAGFVFHHCGVDINLPAKFIDFDGFKTDAIAAVSIEAAAERVFLHIVDGPFPYGDAGAGGLIPLIAFDRSHAFGKTVGEEGDSSGHHRRHQE